MASISGASMYSTPSYISAPPNGVVRKGALVSSPSITTASGTALMRSNPAYGSIGKGLAIGAGATALIGIILLPSLVVTPWIIKQFKPEMSYGKRVAIGLAIGAGMALIRDIVTPAEVKVAREQERIRQQQERAAEAEERARDWERQVAASYARAAQ